jgi:cyanate permease
VSQRHLVPADRAKGIAVSSAGIFCGMVVALVLGAVFGVENLRALLVVQALLAVAAAVALCGYLRVPARVAVPVEQLRQRRLRDVWADPVLRRLVGLACVGFGVFVALTTWLQALLEPAGVSADEAGLMLLVMVVVGVAGSALLPPLLAARGREPVFLAASIGAGVAGLLALAAAPGVVVGFVALAVIGAALLTDLPVLLELVDRQAGAANGAAGATAGALVWLAGNAAGLVAALIVQVLQDRPASAFIVQAVLLTLGVPLLVGVWRAPRR